MKCVTLIVGQLTGVSVRAYVDSTVVNASVEIVGVGTYTTPFSLELPPGNYTLNATYNSYSASKTVTVVEGEFTDVVFTFEEVKPPEEIPLWVWLAAASGTLFVFFLVMPGD